MLVGSLSLACVSTNAASIISRLSTLQNGDVITCTKEYLAKRTSAQRLADLRWHTGSLVGMRRMAAAALLNPANHEERALLEVLLQDNYAVIRRTAAQTLLGAPAGEREAAMRYAYLDVLETEAEAREILHALPGQSLSEQYASTRMLIALGPGALFELRKVSVDSDAVAAVSAMCALNEIYSTQLNTSYPIVSKSLDQKMKTKVDAEFVDCPLEESLAFVSQVTRIPVRSENLAPNVARPINLSVRGMPIGNVVHWIAELADLEIAFLSNEIILRPRAFALDERVEITDARDMVDLLGKEQVEAALNLRKVYLDMGIENGFIFCRRTPNTVVHIWIHGVLEDLRARNPRVTQPK